MGGGVNEKNATVQKLKIPLKPKWKDNPDQPFYTGEDDIPD